MRAALLRDKRALDVVCELRIRTENKDVKDAVKSALDALLDALASAMVDDAFDVGLRRAAFAACWDAAEQLLARDSDATRTATVAVRGAWRAARCTRSR